MDNAIEVEIDNKGTLGFLQIREVNGSRFFEELDEATEREVIDRIAAVVA